TEVQRRGTIAAEIGDLRIVRVQHEPSIGAAERLMPALGDRLELAVAVELVAEQVRQQDRAWLELLDERLEPELVDLEQSELPRDAPARASRGEQGRGDAAGHVGPRLVVHQADTGML